MCASHVRARRQYHAIEKAEPHVVLELVTERPRSVEIRFVLDGRHGVHPIGIPNRLPDVRPALSANAFEKADLHTPFQHAAGRLWMEIDRSRPRAGPARTDLTLNGFRWNRLGRDCSPLLECLAGMDEDEIEHAAGCVVDAPCKLSGDNRLGSLFEMGAESKLELVLSH